VTLRLNTSYWNDPQAKAAFKKFIMKIHNLDFTEWDSCGYWDDAYTPFSFFEDDKIIASMCVYSMEAIIHGERTKVAQISGVGTLPDRRRQGLNRRLTELGMDWAGDNHAGVFLFSDTDAIPFYEAGGFSPIQEYVETIPAEPAHPAGKVVELDPDSQADLDTIYRYASSRTPLSDRFSVLNPKLVLFHALYTLRNQAFEIPDLNCVVFYRRKDACLEIIDILAENIPAFEDLYPYISDESDRTIEFTFHTEKLGLSGMQPRVLEGNHLYVLAPFPLDKPVFPFTCRA
jgi:GNAT superfamily N-acetyltransferase